MTDHNDPPSSDGNVPLQPQTPPTDGTPASPGPGDVSATLAPSGDVNGAQIGNITNKYDIRNGLQLEDVLKAQQSVLNTAGSLLAIMGSRTESDAPRPPVPENMPTTDEDVNRWFCKDLTLAERCQVRATAILHGAPAHLVNSAAHEMLVIFQRRIHGDRDNSPNAAGMGSVILERAFATVRASDTDGARRVFWKDADENGFSEFGLRVLRLLAHEIEGSEGYRSENCLSLITSWVSTIQGEKSVRAAHALGVIKWDQGPSEFENLMGAWAASGKIAEREGAPLLALGAFAAEWSYRKERGESTPSDLKTQRTLDNMAYRSLHSERQVSQALTVSTAYSLIGLQWTRQALDGLDYLLGLDVKRMDDAPDVIPFPICFPALIGYMQLAATGLARPALARLGARARLLTQRLQMIAGRDETRKEKRRKDRLLNAHLAFFFVVSAAIPPTNRKWPHYGEKDRIEERPRLHDNRDGRDVLLDGVLSANEGDLRLDVQSLLWSSLASDTHNLARDTLRRWVEIVATNSDDPHGVTSRRGEAFFVSLGEWTRKWDAAAGLTGYAAPASRYRNYVSEWAAYNGVGAKQAISAFAKRVLSAFPTDSTGTVNTR